MQQSRYERGSRIRKSTEVHKQNIISVINKLTPEELEKVSDLLRSGAGSMEEKPEDEGSDALVVEDIEADQKADEDD